MLTARLLPAPASSGVSFSPNLLCWPQSSRRVTCCRPPYGIGPASKTSVGGLLRSIEKNVEHTAQHIGTSAFGTPQPSSLVPARVKVASAPAVRKHFFDAVHLFVRKWPPSRGPRRAMLGMYSLSSVRFMGARASVGAFRGLHWPLPQVPQTKSSNIMPPPSVWDQE